MPNKKDSLHFAVIGDSGTGGSAQYEVAREMVAYRARFPFDLILMLGDNLYGGESPRDYQSKFEAPYKDLLAVGVKFYAALGNHDDPKQRFYKPFNMNGQRYYSFKAHDRVRFFALDSNYLDREQLAWLERELKASDSRWKICFFHHPLYSSGRQHGPDADLRAFLEPLFLKYGVKVVLTGHEHFYERIKPQKGIYYFISGGSAKLRRGNIARTDLTAKGFDQDFHFMLIEIEADLLHFQTISRTGTTIDSGVVPLQLERPAQATAAAK
ncbi:MAG: metallophosphoesterase [Acidobacteria bacterium]|nr:metallophosphoesterase [Acidobacteriota bacterium]